MSLFGIDIRQSENAVARKARVERTLIRKRRKNYRVVIRLEPAVLFVNPQAVGMPGRAHYVVHPTLYAQLLGQAKGERG